MKDFNDTSKSDRDFPTTDGNDTVPTTLCNHLNQARKVCHGLLAHIYTSVESYIRLPSWAITSIIVIPGLGRILLWLWFRSCPELAETLTITLRLIALHLAMVYLVPPVFAIPKRRYWNAGMSEAILVKGDTVPLEEKIARLPNGTIIYRLIATSLRPGLCRSITTIIASDYHAGVLIRECENREDLPKQLAEKFGEREMIVLHYENFVVRICSVEDFVREEPEIWIQERRVVPEPDGIYGRAEERLQ